MRLARVCVTLEVAQVQPLLLSVSGLLESGFKEEAARQFSADLNRVRVGEDVLIEPTVRHRAVDMPLIIDAFKETTVSVSVVFMAPQPLVDQISGEIRLAFGEVGQHEIPAEVGEAQ
ncbi:MAG: hypothetical protein ABI565_14250 [Vicinamibacteria bacterium]